LGRSLTNSRRRIGLVVSRTYPALYGRLCGRHPHLRPWHYQWLPGRILYRSLPLVLARVEGEVLDVGCEDSPYRDWMPGASGYVGLDVSPGPKVDVVVSPDGTWPLPDHRFDVVLCTQVLEHVRFTEHTLSEIHRVTRPGGNLILSVPFIYNEHGQPHDYRRLSQHGVRALLEDDWEIQKVIPQGGIGSSAGALVLNWMQLELSLTGPRILVALALLPVWIALTTVVNAAGALFDWIDRTGLFYGNVLVMATRREDDPS
jgi:SAM-dependent methyltransferase